MADDPRTRREAGMSLVELMVAMTIGLFLIGGALTVYTQSQAAMRVNDSLSRMQENLRFALDVMEPDLRLANFWGLHNWPIVIEGRAGEPDPLTATTPIAGDCAADWAIDVAQPVQGWNGVHPGWACLPLDQWRTGTDIVVVRHASENPVATAALEPGKVYVRSDESPRGALFAGVEPGGFSPLAENHELVTNAYFIRPWTYKLADGKADGIPSLRRIVLADGGAAPRVEEREVIPGVEDLQVQFGIDTRGGDDAGSAGLYVDPDNPVLANPNVRIVALRIWLVMRSQTIEEGFTDDTRYIYADLDYTIDGRPDLDQGFRRVLVSRTIDLRNL